MSFITVVEVKDKEVRVSKKHYREVLHALNNGMKIGKGSWKELDCGYMLIDHDKKVLLSNQSGFALYHLDRDKLKEMKREWEIVEIP